jgi:oxygen-independent coproporphyrinogen-3 oxidase
MKPLAQQTEGLTRKYDYTPFMYIDYPHKSFWSPQFGDDDYRRALTERFSQAPDAAAMLYVHMPYCQKQCYFCTCHVFISTEYDDVKSYLGYLHQEIELLRQHFERTGIKPNIQEIHLGGGTPTYINEPDFEELVNRLGTICDVAKLSEFSIEIDPRRIKRGRLQFYHSKGINRISFGIQDFDLEVMKAVNRVQPAKIIQDLLTPDVRALFSHGINFDILCGLPRQTVESIKTTANKVVELSPDRICFNYMDYAPKFAKHQLLMPTDQLPGVDAKKQLFIEAMEVLMAGGYVRTGYDHFAKPDDDVVKAMNDNKMVWNQLGYTPGRCEDTIAIGVSGSTKVGGSYAQNVYALADYQRLVTEGKLPVFRGYRLTEDDVIRRDLIQRLRGYFAIDYADIETAHGIRFQDYFQKDLARLGDFVADGILEIKDTGLQITGVGQQFVNHVCASFDNHIDRKSFGLVRRPHL